MSDVNTITVEGVQYDAWVIAHTVPNTFSCTMCAANKNRELPSSRGCGHLEHCVSHDRKDQREVLYCDVATGAALTLEGKLEGKA